MAMRGTAIGAFALGFAAGAAALALALWFAGMLRPAGDVNKRTATPQHVQEQPKPAVTASNTEIGAQGEAERSIPQLDREAETQGEADRSIPQLDHPIVPVAGASVGQLHDTFSEKRDGHEHEALDIPAARGTPVLAAVEGNVVKLFQSKDGGLTVYQFDDSQDYCYYYAHLDRYAAGLRDGVLLRQGEVLGYVGTTGNAPPDAPHLHFSIFRLGPDKSWWKGDAIDPLPMLNAQGR